MVIVIESTDIKLIGLFPGKKWIEGKVMIRLKGGGAYAQMSME
jgi:hypothetical protein